MRKHFLTIFVAFVILVVLVLYMVSFQLRQDKVAVVTTFGKAKAEVTEAGLHWKWPWPIQRVYLMDRRLHTYVGMFDDLLTEDQQPLRVVATVAWRIKEPLKFLKAVETIELANQRLRKSLDSVKKSIIARYKLDDLISTNREELKFEAIEDDMKDALAEEAREKYGVEVALVRLKRLALPEGVMDSIYASMRSERRKIAADFKAKGEGQANQIRREAEAVRDTLLKKADAEAQKIRADGDAEAAKYYKEFQKHPELAIFLTEIKSLREVTKERTTIITDASTPPFNLFNNNFYPAEESK